MQGIRFRPEKIGLRKTLFDLEADIMEIVWQLKEPNFTVSEIHLRLERSREIAYTTVMTTISRLFDKNILQREKQGRKYIYQAVMTENQFLEKVAQKFMQGLQSFGKEQVVSLLVEHVESSDLGELDKLQELIERRKREIKDA